MKTLILAMMAAMVAATTTTVLAVDSDGKKETSDKTVQTNQNTIIMLRMDGQQAGDISLSGEWDFTYTHATAADIPDFPPDSAFDARITVPGYWDDQTNRLCKTAWWPEAKFTMAGGKKFYGVNYLTGVGWHRTIIDAPSAWKDRSVTLTTGMARGWTFVWLNRRLVGRHNYGTDTPFTFDLTGLLKVGEKNELIIAVDNVHGFNTTGCPFGGLQWGASGIATPVSLHVSEGPGRIADLYVKPGSDLKEIVWEVDLDMPGMEGKAPGSRLLWEVLNAADNTVVDHGEVESPAFEKANRVTWRKRIETVKPWSDRVPNLYRTRVQWMADGKLWDKREQRFGLRRWSSEGRKLFLNGNPTYLRGDTGMYDFPPYVCMPMDKAFWISRIKRMKELGFNYICMYVPAPRTLLDAADELGMIIQCGDVWTSRDSVRSYYKEVWNPLVVWTRGHPSMSIYIFAAEGPYYEGQIEQFQKQRDLVKQLNPESLVLPEQAACGIEYGFTKEEEKELTMKPFPYHAKRLEQYTRASDMMGCRCWGIGGTFYVGWRQMETNFSVFQRPLVAHELYMRSSYLSPDNAVKYTGRLQPGMYTKLRDQLANAGLLDKWRVYWENSARLNAIFKKYCVEKARKCDNLAGYEFLGFIDQYIGCWGTSGYYPSGMLDEFMQFKPGDTAEVILRYSNESVLLLDYEDDFHGRNRSYWARDSLPVDIMISLYGPNPIQKGSLSWVLKESESGKVVLKGEQPVENIRNGYVSTIHSLKIDWPEVKKTTKLNFSASLAGSGYQLANDWDFWVFPKLEPPDVAAVADKECKKKLERRYPKIGLLNADSKEKLHIVSEITAKELEYLVGGGDVLLLGTRPFPVHFFRLYPGQAGRNGMAVGAVINTKHPVFEGLPDEGWGDWLFVPLLDASPRIFFDKAECAALDVKPWKPILEMISEPDRVDKVAMIFDARVGKGRLLVSSCPAEMNNPSRVALVDGLMRYVSGSDFHPEMELSPMLITMLIQGQRAAAPAVVSKSAAAVRKADGREWTNSERLYFDSNVFCRIGNGPWLDKRCVDLGEGITKVTTKSGASSTNEATREVCIDLKPPTITLAANPPLSQQLSVYYATPETLFCIEAEDDLSGVKAVEVSIDGVDYAPYAGPFKLKEGSHSLRCRVTDYAGNEQKELCGYAINGTPRSVIIVVGKEE